ISSAQIAKWGLFLMRTDPTAISRGRKHEGITAFIVDMELPGIEVRPIREITGDSLFCEVFFTDAKIPAGDRLGDEGNGWLVSMGALGQERVGSAGQAISVAHDLRSLWQTARTENPDALRDPAIRERVANLHIQIEATRLLIARALSKVLKGDKGWPEVPLAKLQWGYISLWLAELALDVLGPTGTLLKGSPGAIDGGLWARNYVWQRYTPIGAGPTAVKKNIIAGRALKLERCPPVLAAGEAEFGRHTPQELRASEYRKYLLALLARLTHTPPDEGGAAMSTRTAIITGASRGFGLALAR